MCFGLLSGHLIAACHKSKSFLRIVQTSLPVSCQVIEGLVEEEALGSYVLVEKEDVLDAIGTFVAAYLATVPEAQHMKPAELQQALTSTFRVCGLACEVLTVNARWNRLHAKMKQPLHCSDKHYQHQ